MIGEHAEFDAFIRAQHWGVLSSLRRDGSPVSSMVAYAVEGDALVVSTPGATFKRRSIEADARVNLCIISDQAPFNFVAVEGMGRIETDDIDGSTRAVFANIATFGYRVPENLVQWLRDQARVIIRIKPTRVSGVIR